MKALIITGRGVQDQEFVYPFYRLQEAGYEVDVAVPADGGGACCGIIGVRIDPNMGTLALTDDRLGGYGVLVVPGGVKCMERLRLDQHAVAAVRRMYELGAVVASICSGAQMLISADLCRGRKISAYPAMRIDVENAGGTFVDVPAMVDDRIVTSPHYRHLGAWMALTLTVMERQRLAQRLDA